jgi:hypothetical protein
MHTYKKHILLKVFVILLITCLAFASAAQDTETGGVVSDNSGAVHKEGSDNGGSGDSATVITDSNAGSSSVGDGAVNPDPEAQLSFFQKLFRAFSDAFSAIGGWFKSFIFVWFERWEVLREEHPRWLLVFQLAIFLTMISMRTIIQKVLRPAVRFQSKPGMTGWIATKLITYESQCARVVQLFVVGIVFFYFFTHLTLVPNVRMYIVSLVGSLWTIIAMELFDTWGFLSKRFKYFTPSFRDVLIHASTNYLSFFNTFFFFAAMLDYNQGDKNQGFIYVYNVAGFSADGTHRLTDVFWLYITQLYVIDGWSAYITNPISGNLTKTIVGIIVLLELIPFLVILSTNDDVTIGDKEDFNKWHPAEQGLIAYFLFCSAKYYIKTGSVSSKDPPTVAVKSAVINTVGGTTDRVVVSATVDATLDVKKDANDRFSKGTLLLFKTVLDIFTGALEFLDQLATKWAHGLQEFFSRDRRNPPADKEDAGADQEEDGEDDGQSGGDTDTDASVFKAKAPVPDQKLKKSKKDAERDPLTESE